MSRFPFFGSDDDDDGVEKINAADIENRSDVEVIDLNDLDEGTKKVGGLRIHTISVEDDTATPPATEPADPGGRSSPAVDPDPETGPAVDPDPDTGPASRGTFAFPNDRDFMQKLEARAVNGDGRFTETVYVLTGPSHSKPVDLFRLDNSGYYGSSTRTSVSFKPRKMARKVAACFPDGQQPGLIARFHTHPPGSTPDPSGQDKQSAQSVRRAFEKAFGTDSFEFFHGIHALDEHGLNPTADERQNPSTRGQELRWVGERYRHKLAVYGNGFNRQKDITIVNG